MPSLRDRIDDIPLLVNHFVMMHASKLGKRITKAPRKVMDALQTYAWPGNVRELANVIERAAIITQGEELQLGDWLPKLDASGIDSGVRTLQEIERDYIIKALEAKNWRVSGERGAAKTLGLKPTTLEARMKKLGVSRDA